MPPVPRVTLSVIPPRSLAYTDWLVTGLLLLHEKGEITLSFGGNWWDRLLRSHPKVMGLVRKISPDLENLLSPADHFCLGGSVTFLDKTVAFAVDYTDGPFNFALGYLESADRYFKVQCPLRFESHGFPLSRKVRIPYHPEVLAQAARKIRPALLGRPLGLGLDLRRHLKILRDWEAEPEPGPRPIRLLASFGSDRPPKPRPPGVLPSAPHNYGNEAALLARLGTQISHPNLKRGEMIRLLRSLDQPDINARLWASSDPALAGPPMPETEYPVTLGRTVFNVNISGFRRSLPYRFMDSLLRGCAVATDSLAVGWYAPWARETEVFEFGDLGYELPEEVNWPSIRERVTLLHRRAGTPGAIEMARAIRAEYQRKWAPEPFARYILSECRQSAEER